MSSEALKARLSKGVLAQALCQAVNFLVPVATIPMLLSHWGAHTYGEWLVLYSIPTYLSMSDVGFATSAAHRMAMLVSGGDRKSALEVFQSTHLAICMLSIFVFCLVALALKFVSPAALLNFSSISGSESSTIVLILAGYSLIGLQGSLMYAGFFCEGNYGIGLMMNASTRLLEFLMMATVVLLGAGPIGAAIAVTVGRVCGSLGMTLVLRATSPWLAIGFSKARYETLRREFGASLAFTMFPLSNGINMQGPILIIGTTLGAESVVAFNAVRTLTRMPLVVLRSLAGIVQPEISAAFGRNDIRTLRGLHQRSSQLALWISASAAVIMLATGRTILRVWTRGAVKADWLLLGLLVAVTAVNGLWNSSLLVQYATNRHQRLAFLYFAACVLIFPLGKPLATRFGTGGVACALLITEGLMLLVAVPPALALSGDRVTSFLNELLRPPFFVVHFARERVRLARSATRGQ